jgi:hypothetical protein
MRTRTDEGVRNAGTGIVDIERTFDGEPADLKVQARIDVGTDDGGMFSAIFAGCS